MTAPGGLFVIDCADPLHPRLAGQYSGNFLRNPRCVAIQFQYALVTDDDGVKVIDLTNPEHPIPVRSGVIPLRSANRLYLARTYAYVANGPEGLAIIDIENPEKPRLDQMFNASGALNDTRAVQIGSVNGSQFALVADGRNGLRVLQLISPDTVPGAQGFGPRPNPKLIATYLTKGEAICVSRGLERDRVVDETGGQTVVFGRRGSRPFHLSEMQRFLRHDGGGNLFRVEDVVRSGQNLLTRGGETLVPISSPSPSATPVARGIEPTPVPSP